MVALKDRFSLDDVEKAVDKVDSFGMIFLKNPQIAPFMQRHCEVRVMHDGEDYLPFTPISEALAYDSDRNSPSEANEILIAFRQLPVPSERKTVLYCFRLKGSKQEFCRAV